MKSFLCAIFVSCQIPHKFLRCLLIVGRHRELCLSTCYNCRISFWNMTQKIQPWKKTKKIISLMNEIYQIYLLWFGRLYISFMLCSVFIYFSSYYQLSIYSWLIYILWMVLIYCFPDSGVDAVVRIEPSHGRNFFSVKKKCCNFFIFSPRNILFVSLEFCSMYRYVAFSLPVDTFSFTYISAALVFLCF